MTAPPEGTKMIGYNAPIEVVEELDRISMKRWNKLERSLLLKEAVDEFIKRENNPHKTADEIREAFKEYPGLVCEAMNLYEAQKDQKK